VARATERSACANRLLSGRAAPPGAPPRFTLAAVDRRLQKPRSLINRLSPVTSLDERDSRVCLSQMGTIVNEKVTALFASWRVPQRGEPSILSQKRIANGKHRPRERPTDDIIALEAISDAWAHGIGELGGVNHHHLRSVIENAIFDTHGVKVGKRPIRLIRAGENQVNMSALVEHVADGPVHEIGAAPVRLAAPNAPNFPADPTAALAAAGVFRAQRLD
jgi:hypothetical protein